MKKLISVLLCAVLLIALAACGKGNLPGLIPSASVGTEAPTAVPTEAPAQAPTEAPTPGPDADWDAVVYPEKAEMTEEEQAIADRYYEELKEVYPEFANIPRELLSERVSIDEYTDVTFTFCLGGCPTDYKCVFSTSPRFPEGQWYMYGEEYAGFADRVLTKGEMASIRTMLFNSVSAFVEENKLDGSGLNADEIHVCWYLHDGKLYALTEYIANVTQETTETFGCLSHAHVFGRVLVEFAEGGAVLTDNEGIGS